MKNKILIPLFILTVSLCFGQKIITWEDLSKVEFVEKYFPDYEENFLSPKFSKSVKALDGKMVTISGYFLHISPKDKLYMLSKGPMSSCFFCGVGGPETAIELQFKKRLDVKTDDIVTVTGKFKLNPDDVEHFNYIISECKITRLE